MAGNHSIGTGQDTVDEPEIPLVAYRLREAGAPTRLVTAPTRRQWMGSSAGRGAYDCLPMVLANQAGWFLLSSHSFKVRWTGDEGVDALEICYLTGTRPFPAVSNFGRGILTIHVPYLFRTPPGYNLLVRGPANCPKDGAYPLEGLVETDWTAATFTMNWQVTRPNHTVLFEEHEPIAMVVPQRRGELERFRPEFRSIALDDDVQTGHAEWALSRRKFIGALRTHPADIDLRGMRQRHYLRGTSVSGSEAPQHQRSLRVLPFSDASADDRG